MAVQFYAVQRKSDNKIVSYVSDDVDKYDQVGSLFQLVGPYATQDAAHAALDISVLDPANTTIANLKATPSANWTLKDVADWLKIRG